MVTIRYESMDSQNESMFLRISYTIPASLQIFLPNVQFKISELISNQTWTTEELSTSTPKNFETTVAKENTDKVAKISISNKKLVLILCWVKIFSSTVLVKTSLRIVFVISENISWCRKYLEQTYRLLKIIEKHMIFHVTK